MTKTEAFKKFNIKLRNTRWSWSGISADRKHVASTIWMDEFRVDDGVYKTKVTEEWNYDWRLDKGNLDRIEHFKHCRDELNSMFWVVFVKPRQIIFNQPREAESHRPFTKMMFKLTSFDENTGLFTSESVKETVGKYKEFF